MKNKVMVAALLLAGVVSSAFGQSKTGSSKAVQNPNFHEVNMTIKSQMQQIRKDLRAGKLTSAQAKAALGNLKAIRQVELQYFHQNGGKDISSAQRSQLDGKLSQNNPL